jgi:uncharacterized SAM-binding protein YcdF (DUF218 family)
MLNRIIKWFFLTFGFLAFLSLLLCLTPVPFRIWYYFATSESSLNRPPDYIVTMGGGGMPSEAGMMRIFYSARVARQFPKAKVIISLPGDTIDRKGALYGLKKEMILRGVDSGRIIFENRGTSTRGEAFYIFMRLGPKPAICVVSSPEHIRRSVLSFRKAGFTRVDGVPAFTVEVKANFFFNDKTLGGRKWVPEIGKNLVVRYTFWTQLKYEQQLIRESLALFYYKLNGWI